LTGKIEIRGWGAASWDIALTGTAE